MAFKTGKRWRCFMDVEVGAGNVERIVLELFNDSCPKTCENFRALCTGEMGLSKISKKPLNYKGSIFHRVIKGFMVQGGDISSAPGRGGESIYGGLFEDENLEIVHDTPYLLSMANSGPNANGSQFFITTAPAPHLDGHNVVFGRVLTGQNIVAYLENVPVDRTCRPLTDVRIVKCGQLVLSTKSKSKKKRKRPIVVDSGGSSSDDSSDLSSGSMSSAKEHIPKKQMISKKNDDHESSEKHLSDSQPLVSSSSINAEDIPPVPKNRLFRKEPQEDSDIKKFRDRISYMNKSRSRGKTKSGRTIKGRGVFRYRTPSRSRSRSGTPPHWKQAQSRTIKMAEYKQMKKEQKERAEELKRKERARLLKYQHSRMKAKIDEPYTKSYSIWSQNPPNNEEEEEDCQKESTQSSFITSSNDPTQDDHRSDLEEGETLDNELPIIDYNALDYEDSRDVLEKMQPFNGKKSNPWQSSWKDMSVKPQSGIDNFREDKLSGYNKTKHQHCHLGFDDERFSKRKFGEMEKDHNKFGSTKKGHRSTSESEALAISKDRDSSERQHLPVININVDLSLAVSKRLPKTYHLSGIEGESDEEKSGRKKEPHQSHALKHKTFLEREERNFRLEEHRGNKTECGKQRDEKKTLERSMLKVVEQKIIEESKQSRTVDITENLLNLKTKETREITKKRDQEHSQSSSQSHDKKTKERLSSPSRRRSSSDSSHKHHRRYKSQSYMKHRDSKRSSDSRHRNHY